MIGRFDRWRHVSTPVHTGTAGPGDAELISSVRDGDTEAYGELFARHVEAARRLARQLVSAGDADDLVSEAFAKVLVVLQRGGGPDLAFRAYLLTSVRRLHVDRIRAGSKLQTTDDLTPYDPGVPFRDTAVEGFESAAAARAFASLPERWQMVLWHTEVEELKPAEIAPLLGMSSNSVSALAYRAREGLRQAFLTMHAQGADDEACEWAQDNLGAYVRNGCSRRDAARVEQHLGECRRCTAIYLELTEVNSNLRGILAPWVLGSAATGYLASFGGEAAGGGVVALLGRARDVVVRHAATTAVAGVAAAVLVAGAVASSLGGSETPVASGTETPPAPVATSASPDAPDVDPATSSGPPRRNPTTPVTAARVPVPATVPAGTPSEPPDEPAPTDPPSETAEPESSGVPTASSGGSPSSPSTPTTPTSPTTPPTDSPTPIDLEVVAAATPIDLGGLVWQVEVHVTGPPTVVDGQLTMTADTTIGVSSLDPGCALLQLSGASCSMPTVPATYTFHVVAQAGTALVISAAPGPDFEDDHPHDNTTVITLAS